METPSQNDAECGANCVTDSDTDRDYQRYSQLLDLWSRENSIKTQKLQFFFLTNALLAIGYTLTQEMPGGALLCAVGAALSLIWTLSLGRTILFQKRWQALLRELSVRYQSDSRFQLLASQPQTARLSYIARLIGSVPSRRYLIGAPFLGLLFWLWLYIKSA